MPKPKQIKWKTPHIINTWFVAAAVSYSSISFSCFSRSCKNSPGSGLMKLVQLFAEYFAAWKLWPFEMTRTEQSFVFEIIFCSVKSFFWLQSHFSSTSNHHQIFVVNATYSFIHGSQFRITDFICMMSKRQASQDFYYSSNRSLCLTNIFAPTIPQSRSSLYVHYLLLKSWYVHLISRPHCKFLCVSFQNQRFETSQFAMHIILLFNNITELIKPEHFFDRMKGEESRSPRKCVNTSAAYLYVLPVL